LNSPLSQSVNRISSVAAGFPSLANTPHIQACHKVFILCTRCPLRRRRQIHRPIQASRTIVVFVVVVFVVVVVYTSMPTFLSSTYKHTNVHKIVVNGSLRPFRKCAIRTFLRPFRKFGFVITHPPLTLNFVLLTVYTVKERDREREECAGGARRGRSKKRV